ncbi:amidase family protein, partial [Bacillus mycoides]|uniref:amidase family protein n=1 Tax=Bacillus mycoides TaxID=1405 RepID=UPI002354A776
GMGMGVKDKIVSKGVGRSCGRKILGKFDGIYDGRVVEKVKGGERVRMGKLKMEELGMGS